MGDSVKFITESLVAPPFELSITQSSLHALSGDPLLELAIRVLFHLEPSILDAAASTDPGLCRTRTLELIVALGYRPARDIDSFAPRFLSGDPAEILPLLQWVLKRLPSLRTRAYLARFLRPPSLPDELFADPQIVSLAQQLSSLQAQFKLLHRTAAAARETHTPTESVEALLRELGAQGEQLEARIAMLKRRGVTIVAEMMTGASDPTTSYLPPSRIHEAELVLTDAISAVRAHRLASDSYTAAATDAGKHLDRLRGAVQEREDAQASASALKGAVRALQRAAASARPLRSNNSDDDDDDEATRAAKAAAASAIRLLRSQCTALRTRITASETALASHTASLARARATLAAPPPTAGPAALPELRAERAQLRADIAALQRDQAVAGSRQAEPVRRAKAAVAAADMKRARARARADLAKDALAAAEAAGARAKEQLAALEAAEGRVMSEEEVQSLLSGARERAQQQREQRRALAQLKDEADVLEGTIATLRARVSAKEGPVSALEKAGGARFSGYTDAVETLTRASAAAVRAEASKEAALAAAASAAAAVDAEAAQRRSELEASVRALRAALGRRAASAAAAAGAEQRLQRQRRAQAAERGPVEARAKELAAAAAADADEAALEKHELAAIAAAVADALDPAAVTVTMGTGQGATVSGPAVSKRVRAAEAAAREAAAAAAEAQAAVEEGKAGEGQRALFAGMAKLLEAKRDAMMAAGQ